MERVALVKPLSRISFERSEVFKARKHLVPFQLNEPRQYTCVLLAPVPQCGTGPGAMDAASISIKNFLDEAAWMGVLQSRSK